MHRRRLLPVHSGFADTSSTQVPTVASSKPGPTAAAAVEALEGLPNVTKLLAKVVIEESVQHWVRVRTRHAEHVAERESHPFRVGILHKWVEQVDHQVEDVEWHPRDSEDYGDRDEEHIRATNPGLIFPYGSTSPTTCRILNRAPAARLHPVPQLFADLTVRHSDDGDGENVLDDDGEEGVVCPS